MGLSSALPINPIRNLTLSDGDGRVDTAPSPSPAKLRKGIINTPYAPGAEAKLQCASEKSRWMWMQKNTPVLRLNKGISCQTAVLSRVAKLRSVVELLHG